MHTRNNTRERNIINKYKSLGFDYVTKGYPDICFFKDDQILFVEVKRKLKKPSLKMGLSPHQRKLHEIFKRLGIEIIIEYI